MSTSTKNMSQSMIENIQNYADQIITLEDFVAGVRQNIGMYIGRKGNYGMINMFREILQNGLDEINKKESPATRVFVIYDEITNRIIVGDNGRGIPHGHIIRIFSDPNTSSNYVKKKGEYSSGLHGVGSKVTNALSSEFIVDSYILGVHHRVEFRDGHPVGEEQVIKECEMEQGTVITFIPEEKVLGHLSVTCEEILGLIKLLLPINKIGTIIDFEGKKKDGRIIKEKLVNIDGLTTNLILKTNTPIITPVMIFRDTGEMKVEASFTYDASSITSDYDVDSFANFCPTTGGTHEKGFIDGICKYFKNYMNKVYLASNKKNKITITNQDVLDGLKGIIHTCHLKPIFTGQAKEELGNEEMLPFVRDVVVEELDKWFTANNNDLQKLCKYFKDVATVRMNAEKGKIKLASKYNASAVSGLPKQYKEPRVSGKNNEFIIVEGKSAKGPAVNGREDNQGIFPVRGKTPNPFTTPSEKIFKNEEIGAIFQIIGCGVGKNCDPSKSKFKKIIITADRDPDGDHIAVNLSSTFAIYAPQLVEAGMLYKSIPPLYSVKNGKKEVFFSTRIEYVEYMQQIFSKKNKLEINGKKLNGKDISKMAYNNIDYTYDLECMSRNYALNPRFLESVIRYSHLSYDKLKKQLKKMYGHTIDIYNDGKFINIVGLVDNVYQMIIITDRFLAESKYIKEKYLYDSSAKYVLNDVECTWLYDLMKMFDNNGSSMKVTRYKGLGELDPAELHITTLSPANRTLIQYTMDSIKEDVKKLRSYDSDKKKLIKDTVATRMDLLG